LPQRQPDPLSFNFQFFNHLTTLFEEKLGGFI